MPLPPPNPAAFDPAYAENLRRRLMQQGRLSVGPRRTAAGRPRLLAMTVAPDWIGIARLPASLSAAGFDVAVLCPRDSFLARTDFACERYFAIPGEGSIETLADAVAAWEPAMILPGDEWNAQLLHHLDTRTLPEKLRQIIRRSCGDPRFYATVSDKDRTLEEAARLGIRVPAQAPAESLDAFAAAHNYPLMIKLSAGMSGLTVRACADAQEAADAIAALRATELPPYIQAPTLSVQEYIDGYPASISFVALEGKLLDYFTYRGEEVSGRCGPSSVVRLIGNADIEQAARRLTAHVGFTGFGGFDFMIGKNGDASLLEMNPRVPITAHLGAIFGHDLAAAFYAALTGTTAPPVARRSDMAALFPHEFWRDPDSPHLKQPYVDIPRDDPGLLRYFMSLRPATA